MNLPETDEDYGRLIGLPKLMQWAFSGIDLTPLGTRLLERAVSHQDDTVNLMNLSIILQIQGKHDLGVTVKNEALKRNRLYHLPAATEQPALRLVAIMGPGDLMANTPLEFLVEDSDVALDMLYVDAKLPFPATVPDHDVAFVAVCESDENRPLLSMIDQAMSVWPRPVLNRARNIAALTRTGVCELLRGVPEIVAPATARVARGDLERVGNDQSALFALLESGAYPVIVRPVGSHAGRGLQKLASAPAVADYLAATPDREFYVTRFVDYAGTDGLYRKYRVALVDGRPYAAHMALSPRWMVHYLNADMLENAQNRELEAQFMAGFENGFAARHAAALRAIHERLKLDYLVIDCAETRSGELLVFEVDSGAVVHAMDSEETFPYKRPQMRKVFAAFRDLLGRAALRKPGYGDAA